jgi:hypothetical protein
MLYREIIAVCSEIHTKHINTLCGQNAPSFGTKPRGMYNNRWTYAVYVFRPNAKCKKVLEQEHLP